MLAARHATWEKRIADETNMVKKSILMRSYQNMLEQERLGATKFDAGLVQGGRRDCVDEIYFFVTECASRDHESKKRKGMTFTSTVFECVRFGLPFREVKPVDGKISVSNDLSALRIGLAHASAWTNGKTYIVSASGKVSIKIMKHALVSPGWYKFGSFGAEQNRGASDGVMYTNMVCQSIEPWKEGPAFYMMHNLCCQLWTNDRFMPRPIDPKYYPPLELINDIEQEMRREKSVVAASAAAARAASSSSSDAPAPEDESANMDYELMSKAFNKAFNEHLRMLGIDWQLHDELYQQSPNSRHPYIIPLIMDEATRAAIGAVDDRVLTEHQDVFFAGDIRAKKSGSELKVFQPSEKNPFTMHVNAAATTSVMRIDTTDGSVSTLKLALSMKGNVFFHHLGVVNPFVAQGVLPRVLPTIPMTVVGSPNAQITREKDDPNNEAVRTLIIDVFNPPIVDYLAMIRNNSVQVTSAYAVHEINKYIKTHSATARINDAKASAAMLLDKAHDPSKIHKHIFESNMVANITNNLVFNCFENAITVSAKKGSATHRFYAMTGLVPNEALLAEYRAAAAAFHAAQPDSDEARSLHAQLEQHAEKLSAELKKPDGASEFFLINEELAGHGVTPTKIIWAISRELDHITSANAVYANEAFSPKAVRERSAYITALNEEKLRKVPPPSPMTMDDTPSLDMDAVAPREDPPVAEEEPAPAELEVEESEDVPLVEDRPKGRKRREAPVSPGKKNAVTKKERLR